MKLALDDTHPQSIGENFHGLFFFINNYLRMVSCSFILMFKCIYNILYKKIQSKAIWFWD